MRNSSVSSLLILVMIFKVFSRFFPSSLRLRLALPRNNDVDVLNSVPFGVLDQRESPCLSHFGVLDQSESPCLSRFVVLDQRESPCLSRFSEDVRTENLELLDKKLYDCKNELQHYESSPYQSKQSLAESDSAIRLSFGVALSILCSLIRMTSKNYVLTQTHRLNEFFIEMVVPNCNEYSVYTGNHENLKSMRVTHRIKEVISHKSYDPSNQKPAFDMVLIKV